MRPSAVPSTLDHVAPRRELALREFGAQLLSYSLPARPGWTQMYELGVAGDALGYAGVAIGGPWKGAPTVFEFHLAPERRRHALDLFVALLDASGATHVRAQTNDALLTTMLFAACRELACEKILFRDAGAPPSARGDVTFRRATPADAPWIFAHEREPVGEWVLEVGGEIAATGGMLFHYNPPYGDLFMEVAPRFRGRGLGTHLVRELKRACYEQGRVPAARCDPTNIASWRTLEAAGFVPCAHLLLGTVDRERVRRMSAA